MSPKRLFCRRNVLMSNEISCVKLLKMLQKIFSEKRYYVCRKHKCINGIRHSKKAKKWLLICLVLVDLQCLQLREKIKKMELDNHCLSVREMALKLDMFLMSVKNIWTCRNMTCSEKAEFFTKRTSKACCWRHGFVSLQWPYLHDMHRNWRWDMVLRVWYGNKSTIFYTQKFIHYKN